MGVSQTAGVTREVHREAFFFGAGSGARFCLLHEPAQGAIRGQVLYVPPFAEEQNRSRRAAAHCARLLAESGFAVLQMDLAGCGDSGGDFSDASWAGWLEDLRHGLNILSKRAGGPVWLWGVRAGALLLCDLLARSERHPNLLLWQPVLCGAQHLKQFLRLRSVREATQSEDALSKARKSAAQAMPSPSAPLSLLDVVSHEHATRRARGETHQWRADWVSGRAVEVAGYTVSPALAFGLDRALFALPSAFSGRVVWVEQKRAQSDTAPAQASSMIASLRGSGVAVDLHLVNAPPFWSCAETVEAEAFARSSLQALEATL